MLPQRDLLLADERFVAFERKVLPLVGPEDIVPGDLLGVAYPPPMRVPLNALQHDNQITGPSCGSPAVLQVSAVTDSPFAVAADTTSPSPALLKRLNPAHCNSLGDRCIRGPSRFVSARLGTPACVSHELRRLLRPFRRCACAGATGRLKAAHCVYQPRYPRLRKPLDSARLGS